MRRPLTLAAFLLSISLIPVCVSAQRGGGGGHAGGGGHFSGGGGVHSSAGHAMSFSGGHAAFGRGAGYSHGFNRGGTHVSIRTAPYGYGYGRYPYYGWGYPWWGWDNGFWSDNGYSDNSTSDDQDAYASYAPGPDAPPYSEPYMGNTGLHRDIQELNSKIDRLQADVEAKNRPKEQEPATALVFRDQHVEEVHNYAIAGGTLWVLNDASAKKIPLAQLDIPATEKMNDDRGIEFQVPQ
jgi:hypothetical protein